MLNKYLCDFFKAGNQKKILSEQEDVPKKNLFGIALSDKGSNQNFYDQEPHFFFLFFQIF